MRSKLFLVFCLCTFSAAVFVPAKAQAQELLSYPLDTINDEEFYLYKVERSIGLFRIGVNFGVTQAEIVRYNPHLRDRGLHYGETLRIPTHRPVVQQTEARVVETVVTETRVLPTPEPQQPQPEPQQPQPQPEPVKQDPLAVAQEVVAVQEIPAEPEIPAVIEVVEQAPDTRPIIELALMLPFESRLTKRSSNGERMFEFYQGALLALRDLQNDSVRYRLRVYDTERSEWRVKSLCDSTELDSVQGILGLVYPIQIERVAQWSEEHGVPLLLPFSDDIDLTSRTRLMQFNATDEQEADSLCQWIKKQEDLHCIAVEVRDADMSASIRTLRKQMRAHEIPVSGVSLRDIVNDSIDFALDAGKENLFILHSDKYLNVRILLPHLEKAIAQGYRIRIVSQYSWQKEKITLPQVYTSMFTLANGREAYDAQWNTYFPASHVSEAPRYDLLGYDLMQALVAHLNGINHIEGTQSAISWTRIGEGGWQNANVKVQTEY